MFRVFLWGAFFQDLLLFFAFTLVFSTCPPLGNSLARYTISTGFFFSIFPRFSIAQFPFFPHGTLLYWSCLFLYLTVGTAFFRLCLDLLFVSSPLRSPLALASRLIFLLPLPWMFPFMGLFFPGLSHGFPLRYPSPRADFSFFSHLSTMNLLFPSLFPSPGLFAVSNAAFLHMPCNFL